MTTRNETADELEQQGWPAVAEDVREGIPKDVLMSRLEDIELEEDDDMSDVKDIVADMDDDA